MSGLGRNADATAAHIYDATAAQLGGTRNAGACVAVARRLVGAIQAKLEELAAAGAAVACTPGCAFCCHLRVGAFPHEAVALLEHLRTALPRDESAAIVARILENAGKIDGLTVEDHYAARLPCAFLVDGRCAAYEARPSACARYHSLSRARCEHAFEHPRDMGTPRNSRPALLEFQAFGAAVDTATAAALRHAGLSATKAELHQLLRALIENPGAIEDWRAGKGIDAPPA
jgi:Fe-S-cluster containining protein